METFLGFQPEALVLGVIWGELGSAHGPGDGVFIRDSREIGWRVEKSTESPSQRLRDVTQAPPRTHLYMTFDQFITLIVELAGDAFEWG